MTPLQIDKDTFTGLGSQVKLAFNMMPAIKNIAGKAGQVLKNGWKTNEEGAHYLTPAHLRGWVGEGDATRHLPVGMKTLTAVGAASEAPTAFSAADKEGTGKSRSERVGKFIGGTLGGIAGSLPSKAGLVKNVGAMIGATAAGGFIGGKIGKGVNSLVGRENTNGASNGPT